MAGFFCRTLLAVDSPKEPKFIVVNVLAIVNDQVLRLEVLLPLFEVRHYAASFLCLIFFFLLSMYSAFQASKATVAAFVGLQRFLSASLP